MILLMEIFRDHCLEADFNLLIIKRLFLMKEPKLDILIIMCLAI